MTTTHFGDHVLQESQALASKGMDPNLIAGVLCKNDPAGKNYGIGIMLGSDAKPMATSATLLAAIQKELGESAKGVYLNSDAIKEDLTRAVLSWQGVPEKWWPHFKLLLPSDAGTGAVQMALQVACLLKEDLKTLSVESLGWPAYKALATSVRLGFQEFAENGVASGSGVLPLYQAGPMNSTGKVPSLDVIKARVQALAAAGTPVVLDRAYSGFEYARRLASTSFESVMKSSFAAQVEPYLEAGVSVCLAISPTKAFVTFSLRPCGMLLVFSPDLKNQAPQMQKLQLLIRARGSSFEHVVTRAFAKALVTNRAGLESEHAAALARTAEAEALWASLTKGTAMEPYFTEAYAGLFRNAHVKPEGVREIYDAHLYPVFSQGRCRLNVTGLPADAARAKVDVATFAKFCY